MDMEEAFRAIALGIVRNLPEYTNARAGLDGEQAVTAADKLLSDYEASGRSDGLPFYAADWWEQNKEEYANNVPSPAPPPAN